MVELQGVTYTYVKIMPTIHYHAGNVWESRGFILLCLRLFKNYKMVVYSYCHYFKFQSNQSNICFNSLELNPSNIFCISKTVLGAGCSASISNCVASTVVITFLSSVMLFVIFIIIAVALFTVLQRINY